MRGTLVALALLLSGLAHAQPSNLRLTPNEAERLFRCDREVMQRRCPNFPLVPCPFVTDFSFRDHEVVECAGIEKRRNDIMVRIQFHGAVLRPAVDVTRNVACGLEREIEFYSIWSRRDARQSPIPASCRSFTAETAVTVPA